MSAIQLRTVPGLWIGRRTVVQAERVEVRGGETAFHCGACDDLVLSAQPADLRDVVVKCGCGEYNQV